MNEEEEEKTKRNNYEPCGETAKPIMNGSRCLNWSLNTHTFLLSQFSHLTILSEKAGWVVKLCSANSACVLRKNVAVS